MLTGATTPQRFLLIADWGLSQNSSVTLQHILQSAANTTTAPAVLYIADFCYAGEPTHCCCSLTATTVQQCDASGASDVVSKMFVWCKCITALCTKSSLKHHKLPENPPDRHLNTPFTGLLGCIDLCFSGLCLEHSTFFVLTPTALCECLACS